MDSVQNNKPASIDIRLIKYNSMPVVSKDMRLIRSSGFRLQISQSSVCGIVSGDVYPSSSARPTFYAIDYHCKIVRDVNIIRMGGGTLLLQTEVHTGAWFVPDFESIQLSAVS
jgi:hypothetical protein